LIGFGVISKYHNFHASVFQVKALENDIEDLHGEFELDRLDYLETIRKQDQQIKLLQQIVDKIHPVLKKDCNYFNIEKIKREATWNEDQGKWTLPDLTILRTTLPNATPGISFPITSGGLVETFHDQQHMETADDLSKLRQVSILHCQTALHPSQRQMRINTNSSKIFF
uniref:WASH_WAHD domain-containing protein n=1 Tax=Gongylonema pulchrum TaxID=637853 RepID=A0A183DBQ1_9BILA